jgi:hypothetical protein
MRRIWIPLLASFVCVLGASPALGVPVTFAGTLKVQWYSALQGLIFSATTTGSGSADISYVGGNVDAITSVAAGTFSFVGAETSNPGAFPINDVILNANTGAGSFTGLTSGGGGTMGLLGTFSTNGPQVMATSQGGTQGIGLGGAAFTTGSPLLLTLQGAAWSTGSVTLPYVNVTASGFSNGNFVQLVTPFYYSDGAQPNDGPGFAILDLRFVVPEPEAALLLAAAIVALGMRLRQPE